MSKANSKVKSKRTLESSDDDPDSSSGSASPPPQKNPPASKKSKGEGGQSKASSSSAKVKSGSSKDQKSAPAAADNNEWCLDAKKKVTVREFKGSVYVDIREFYDAGGEMKPGKKGISLTAAQWSKFKEFIPEVDAALKRF